MNNRPRVVLADALATEGVAILEADNKLQVEDFSACSRAELEQGLVGAAGLIVRSGTQADAGLLDAAESLKVVGRAGVGLDNIDVEAATRRGVAVMNAPAGNTVSTAELDEARNGSAPNAMTITNRAARCLRSTAHLHARDCHERRP